MIVYWLQINSSLLFWVWNELSLVELMKLTGTNVNKNFYDRTTNPLGDNYSKS